MKYTVRVMGAMSAAAAAATTAGCSTGTRGDSSHQLVVSGGTKALTVPVSPGGIDPQQRATNT